VPEEITFISLVVPDIGVTEQVPTVGAHEATNSYSADPMADLNVFA